MTNTYRIYTNDKNQPLVYVGEPCDKPILTAANYCKWYGLYLVNSDGSVTQVPIEAIEEVCDKHPDARWVDHLYSPQLFYRLAESLNAYYCEQSVEMVIGRWVSESNHAIKEAEILKVWDPALTEI